MQIFRGILKNGGGAKTKGKKTNLKQEMGGEGTPLSSDIRKYLVGSDHKKIDSFEANYPFSKGKILIVEKISVQNGGSSGGQACKGSPRGFH